MTRRLWLLYLFEWRKLLARRLPWAAALLAVLVTVLAPKVQQSVERLAAVAQSGTPGAPPVDLELNGWIAAGASLHRAMLFVAIVVLVFAASSLAEERAQGTLQALLVRPVRRVEVLLAKALALWSYAALLLLSSLAAALIGAEWSLGLYDVVDPSYPTIVKHVFGDMWTFVLLASAAMVAPLAALVCLGLLVSSLWDHSGYATGVAVGACFLLMMLGEMSRDLMPWLFFAPLEGFAVVRDLGYAYAGESQKLAPALVLRGGAVALAWALGLFLLAWAALARRDVSR